MNQRARSVESFVFAARVAVVGLVLWLGNQALAQQAEKVARPVPGAAEVDEMLRREPVTQETWPAWRQRLLDWMSDTSKRADKAFDSCESFIASNADIAGELKPPLDQDFLAWYVLGRHTLKTGTFEEVKASAKAAEKPFRRSIALDPSFARAHRNLATVLMIQAPQNGFSELNVEAEQELKIARDLDPSLKMKSIPAFVAMVRKDFGRAEQLYNEAIAEEPELADNAVALAISIIQNRQRTGPRAPKIAAQVARHPDNGSLACFHALALAMDDNPRAAVKELERARTLGSDPKQVLNAEAVKAIESAAQPGILEILLWGAAAFVGFYAFVMMAMVAAGLVLAQWTRGAEALRLIGDQPMEIIQGGQVERTREEPWLARMYALCLMAGLILFYISLPFVTVGLLASTLGALYLVLLLGRIPVKLVILILFVGLAMTWAVLKSMFARMGTGSFGVKRPRSRLRGCLPLFARSRDVSTRPLSMKFISARDRKSGSIRRDAGRGESSAPSAAC